MTTFKLHCKAKKKSGRRFFLLLLYKMKVLEIKEVRIKSQESLLCKALTWVIIKSQEFHVHFLRNSQLLSSRGPDTGSTMASQHGERLPYSHLRIHPASSVRLLKVAKGKQMCTHKPLPMMEPSAIALSLGIKNSWTKFPSMLWTEDKLIALLDI